MNPAAKPADRRARRGATAASTMRVVEAEPVEQPALPDGDWHPQTVAWWAMWDESPLAAEFTANDWSELIDTARIHTAFWSGDMKLASELRLRVANFGATPADRARLRITFAQADQAESKAPAKTKPSSRESFGPLKAVGD